MVCSDLINTFSLMYFSIFGLENSTRNPKVGSRTLFKSNAGIDISKVAKWNWATNRFESCAVRILLNQRRELTLARMCLKSVAAEQSPLATMSESKEKRCLLVEPCQFLHSGVAPNG